MTPTDALAHQQRNARNALLTRIDELGDLLLTARANVIIGHRIPTEAMRLRVEAIAEAAEILAAITEALDQSQALGQWNGAL